MHTEMLILTGVKYLRGKAVLTLSNGEILQMPRAMLKERAYRTGLQFDRDAHDAWIQSRSPRFAHEKAISLLASRAKTEQEIIVALRNNAYTEPVIAQVVARLRKAGYINDTAFSEQWTSSRISRSMGTQRIRAELRQKGVDSSKIDNVLSGIDPHTIQDSANRFAVKAAHNKDLSALSDRQKVLAALARRGFSFSISKKALQYAIDHRMS